MASLCIKRRGEYLKSVLLEKQYKENWNCDNLEYLVNLLDKLYGAIDIKNPSKRIRIDCETEQYIFSKNKKIYRHIEQGRPEYFTESSWYLHKETENCKKEQYGHFNLYYESRISKEGVGYLNFIENYIANVSNLLMLSNPAKIDIYIVNEKILTNLFGDDTVTGFFDPLKSKIYIDKLDIHATHEITHALVNQWGIYTNLFCNEGIAEAFKRPIIIPENYIYQIRSFEDIYFDWDDLNQQKYGVGGLFFRFLFQKYGLYMIKEICKDAQNAGMEKTEFVIKKITGEENISQKFVSWVKNMDFENEDWYFRRADKGFAYEIM